MPARELRSMPPSEETSDEVLMQRLAAGDADALGPLHRRYAALVYGLAARTLDRAAAEEIAQDVFLTVWRKAAVFDPGRGMFRTWVLQITHFRILNELRRRGRRPLLDPDPDGLSLANAVDRSPGPVEAAWQAHRREVLRSALAELPPPQREALDLAVLQDLTHEQVAAELNVPLGTAKTRIRSGLAKLRTRLAPQLAALVALGVLLVVGQRWRTQREELARDERALALVTASDAQNLRLAPAPGVPEATHARYRGRAGAPIAVLTLSSFAAPPPGQTYQAWVRHGTTWRSLGLVTPDATGAARFIAEDPALAVLPDAIQVTREPAGGSAVPSAAIVVGWTSAAP